MAITVFTAAELTALASLATNEKISGLVQQIQQNQQVHVDAKNVIESARTTDAAAKGGIWANVLEITLEVFAATAELPRIREQAYIQVLGEFLSKDYPIATVKAYASTGKNVLEKLCGKVDADDLRADTYKDIRARLAPKAEGVVLWESTQQQMTGALSKAKKWLADDAAAQQDMEAMLELAQSLLQRAEAAKQATQKTPANAREVNAMREVAASIGKVATVLDNGPARATGTEG